MMLSSLLVPLIAFAGAVYSQTSLGASTTCIDSSVVKDFTNCNALYANISQCNQTTTEEQAKQLEQIRDTVAPQPHAAPSIKDDVSVSVRQHPTRIAPDMADLRRKREAGRNLKRPARTQSYEGPANTLPTPSENVDPVVELPVQIKEGPSQIATAETKARLDSPSAFTSTPPNGHARKTKKADKKDFRE